MRELPLHYASRIGGFAADILTAGGEADVIAVFQRSFYLLCPKGIVAVCLEDLGAGPINILLPARGIEAPWQGVVRDGMKAAVTAGGLVVHGGFALDVSAAAHWTPPPWPPFQPGHVRVGLQTVQQVHQHWRQTEGLAPLVMTPNVAPKTPTAIAARDLVRTLQQGIAKAIAQQAWTADALRAAILLVGLGPGLTPSGDDLLGGLMLALSARGEGTLRDALFDHIVDELNDLTVPVSAMHLTAAGHGQGHEALHALINSVLVGDAAAVTSHLDAVAAIGATSGIDAVAGVVIGLSL